jgi:5-methylcytosine-specific restriction endonuclease McrA
VTEYLQHREGATVREAFYWVYGNLAMACYAVDKQLHSYDTLSFRIRTNLFYGLLDGTKSITSLYRDERARLSLDRVCVYCASKEALALDHVVPAALGGSDSPENLVYACRSCNSSKGKRDLWEWYAKKDEFPPLSVARRYLKLMNQHCIDNDLMDEPLSDDPKQLAPFRLDLIPYPKKRFPAPRFLRY